MNLSSPAAVSALLRRHSFLPAHRFGQNFLVDANTLARIVGAAELQTGDTVLEVGTGLGVLTRALAEQVGETGHVATIERDPRLGPLHAETLPDAIYPQVRHVRGDALEVEIEAALAQAPTSAIGRGAAVVANIPYNITTPLVARFLEHAPKFRLIVLLVQKEVGERMAAKPASDAYGAFSLFVQYHAEVEIVASVPPTVFYPQPKVTSAIIRLRPRTASPVQVDDSSLMFAIIRAAFQQRRKTLLNALSAESLGWNKTRAAAVLAGAAIDPQRRGETLSLADYARVANCAGNETSPEIV